MRLLLTFTLFTCFINISFTQTIVDKSPWFPSYNLNSVTFCNDNTGWMSSEENILMKTTNGGSSWSELSTTPTLDKLYSFDELHLIGSGALGKSYYSEDGGLNWTEIIYPAGYDVRSIYPLSFNLIYAAGMQETLLKSTDGGESWQVLKHSPNSTILYDKVYFLNASYGWVLGYDSNSMYDKLLYRTSDGGANWEYLGSSYLSQVQFADSIHGYAIDEESVYRTENGGSTWFLVRYTFSPPNTFQVTSDDKIFLSEGFNCNGSGSASVFISTNGGQAWLSTSFEVDDFRIDGIHIFNNGKAIICGEKGYVGKMDNWLYFTPMNGEYFYKVFSFPDRAFALTKNTLYKITDHGNNWEKIDLGFHVNERFIMHFVDTLSGFIMGRPFYNSSLNMIWRTTDGGYNWTLTENELAAGATFCAGGVLFAYSDTAIYKTTDLGISWISAGTNSNISNLYFVDAQNGWYTANQTLYRTTDGGSNWNAASSVPEFNALQFITSDSAWALNNDYFYYSNNGGANWQIYEPSNSYLFRCEDIKFSRPGSFLFIEIGNYLPCDETLYPKRLYEVSNGEAKEIMSFVGKERSNFHFYNENHGWITAGRKLYSIDYGTVSVVQTAITAPDKYSLFQNYPNPFNPTTRIRYSVAVQNNVQLRVTDVLGNIVKVLVNEELFPGTYETEFNAASYASGIYFYTLIAGSYSETKKLLLMK